MNRGLVVAGSRHLVEKLGHPREVLSDDCEPLTNKALAAKLVLEDVGPIRVNMLAPAVESLHRVFEAVKRADPDLYARINSSGSLCVRRIRGTTSSLSTHSFGLAVAVNIASDRAQKCLVRPDRRCNMLKLDCPAGRLLG